MFASLKHKFKIWPRSKHTQSRIINTCTGIKKTKQTNRCTKPAQAPKKNKKNKPLDAPNLHRHQKKLKIPGTMGPLLSSCLIFCFFFWFFWCLSMFGASRFGFFVFFGACQCFVKSESPNLHRHQKKQKN